MRACIATTVFKNQAPQILDRSLWKRPVLGKVSENMFTTSTRIGIPLSDEFRPVLISTEPRYRELRALREFGFCHRKNRRSARLVARARVVQDDATFLHRRSDS